MTKKFHQKLCLFCVVKLNKSLFFTDAAYKLTEMMQGCIFKVLCFPNLLSEFFQIEYQ